MGITLKSGGGEIKVYLHMGFPKTGSSTLQYGLLKPLENKFGLNLITWRKNGEYEHLDYRPSSRLFNFQNIGDQYLKFDKEKINIISDESLTAPLRLRQQNYGKNICSPFKFPSELKRQIELQYPNEDINYTIFLTIRNQSKLIFSQYVEEYNWKIFKNIDLLFNENGEIDLDGYEIYNYSKYLNILINIFGFNSIKLTLFEDWIYEFDYFCSIISDTFNIPFGDVYLALKNNHINKKKKTSDGIYVKGNSTLVPYLNKEQNNQIMEYYFDSNLQLANLFAIHDKLNKYHYL